VTEGDQATSDTWGGRPVARRIADAAPRRRVVVTATVTSVELRRWRGVPAWTVTVDDDTGSLTVVFTGIRPVPGMDKGARCTVEGTVLADGPGLAVWNPRYRFES